MDITELGEKIGRSKKTIEQWEYKLGIQAKRNAKNHRVYNEEDVPVYARIKELLDAGLSFSEIPMNMDLAGYTVDSKQVSNTAVSNIEDIEKFETAITGLKEYSEKGMEKIEYTLNNLQISMENKTTESIDLTKSLLAQMDNLNKQLAKLSEDLNKANLENKELNTQLIAIRSFSDSQTEKIKSLESELFTEKSKTKLQKLFGK